MRKKNFFCICIDIYRIYEGNDYDKIYGNLSTLKNEKLKINNFLIEKYKDMNETPDFAQNYWSRTSQGVYNVGHDSFRLMKWLAYYDRLYFENIIYYDMMGSVLKSSNETT